MSLAGTRTSPLTSVAAGEAMRPGLIRVQADARVRDVASTMAVRGIHAVVVASAGDGPAAPNAAVSDIDVLGAVLIGGPAEPRIGDLEAGSLPAVDGEASLQDVAAVMVQRGVAHVLVNEHASPAGMLSTFDLVAVIGGHDPRLARAVRPAAARPAVSERRLDRVGVGSAMHAGVLACAPSTDIAAVAASLAEHRVHCIVVSGVERSEAGDEQLAWAIVDAMDVVAGARDWDPELTAADLAGTAPVFVREDDSVEAAARVMVERNVTHAIALGARGLPTGVLSTLDVLGICGIP
jgi:CBS domain-containing protein